MCFVCFQNTSSAVAIQQAACLWKLHSHCMGSAFKSHQLLFLFLIIVLVANWNARPTSLVFWEFDSFHSLIHRLMKLVRPLFKTPDKNRGSIMVKCCLLSWFFFFLFFFLFFSAFLIYTLARGKKLSCLCTAPWGAIPGHCFMPLKL